MSLVSGPMWSAVGKTVKVIPLSGSKTDRVIPIGHIASGSYLVEIAGSMLRETFPLQIH